MAGQSWVVWGTVDTQLCSAMFGFGQVDICCAALCCLLVCWGNPAPTQTVNFQEIRIIINKEIERVEFNFHTFLDCIL